VRKRTDAVSRHHLIAQREDWCISPPHMSVAFMSRAAV
jgi:hypothetical protein